MVCIAHADANSDAVTTRPSVQQLKIFPYSVEIQEKGRCGYYWDDYMMNYQKYWGLKDKPFENTINSKFFYPSENHMEALERLLYIIRDGNMIFGLLTGEIGSGKTITKTVLEHQLIKENYEVVSIENSWFAFNAILMEIICQLSKRRVDLTGNDEYANINVLKELLVKIVMENNRHLVILIDEAHQMEKQSLDRLKNLTNICCEDENFMTIILFGQPELKTVVRSLPQLDQRVSLRYHLRFLPADETKGYINHRLKTAGYKKDLLFTHDAIDLISRGTKGIPREINRTCRLALDSGYAQGTNEISSMIIKSILKDLQFQSSLSDDIGKIDQSDIPSSFSPISGKPHSRSAVRIYFLDDSDMAENKIFNTLISMGYSVILSKKNGSAEFSVPTLIDLIIIAFDLNKKSELNQFNTLVRMKDIQGKPVLFVLDRISSKLFMKKLEGSKGIELARRFLYNPFKEKDLNHKIEVLLQRG